MKKQQQQQQQSTNQQNEGQKQGVRFADQQPEIQEEDDQKPKLNIDPIIDISKQQYMNVQDAREYCKKIIEEVEATFPRLIQQDFKVKRKDTAKSLKILLEKLRQALAQLNLGTFDDKIKNYYLTYNITLYIIDICKYLRKSVYAAICVDFYAFCIVSLEGNIILMSSKYMDWRVKFYVELAFTYTECGSLQAAQKTIENGLQKILDQKATEELDPPLPDFIQKMFQNNIRILRVLETKFKLQSGIFNIDAWKKKIDEYFPDDPEGKALAFIESLRINNPKNANIIERKGTQAYTWKAQALQVIYDTYKADLDLLATALEQENEKIARIIEYRQAVQDEEGRIEATTKMREFTNSMIKEKEWKKASSKIPFEYHVELIHFAYEANNIQIINQLLKTAIVRCKYRRIECPFIVDIDVVADFTPFPNIQNGYEKIPYDINESSLRAELKKLRNKQKGTGKEEKKEEEKKKEEKKDDKKGAKGQQQQQQQQKPVQTNTLGATNEELAQINHTYIYLSVKRSQNPENAIYDVDIVLLDEEDQKQIQNKVKEGWRAIAIPVKPAHASPLTLTGKKKQNVVPYLLIKHSPEMLKDEEEKKTLLTDLKPLVGKSRLIRPDVRYQKIECDLRQNKKEDIKNVNSEYVYLQYKTEENYFVNEREVHIFNSFWNLEQSHQSNNPQNKINSVEDEKKIHLDLIYDINKLQDVFQIIKNALEGPLGEQFWEQRKDFLANLAFYLWNKYLIGPLYQFQYVHDMSLSEEISNKEYEKYKEIIDEAKAVFLEGLKVFNLINIRNNECDVLWVTKYNLELSKLLEEKEEYRQSIQNLRWCLGILVNFRDQVMIRGQESQLDVFLPFSLTCDGKKIRKCIENMKKQYVQQKNEISGLVRKIQKKGKLLDQDEENEEEYEFLTARKEFLKDDNTDSIYFTELEKKQYLTELEKTINALHADLLINMLRCEVKQGKQMSKANIDKSKFVKSIREENQYMTKSEALRIKNIPLNEDYGNIPDKQKIKATLMAGDTAKEIRKNVKELQTTLQNAGELETPKPILQKYENYLLQEQICNPYNLAILYMVLSGNKNSFSDQKYLLQQAFQQIIEAEKMEERHLQNCEKDSIFILSTLLDSKLNGQKNDQFYPFSHLYENEYIRKTKTPRTPILISRTSSTIVLKFPPFAPLVNEMEAKKYPEKTQVDRMSVYGKVSAHGVYVSETSTDLENTGVKYEKQACVQIRRLLQNQKYCFAVAGYDCKGDVTGGGIGETGEDILCLQPLPLNLLYCYLSKVCYQTGDFDKAEDCADKAVQFYCEKSQFIDKRGGFIDNQVFFWHLKQEVLLKDVSFIEIQAFVECLIIKGRCLLRKRNDEKMFGKKGKEVAPILKQKFMLKILNFFVLALEASVCVRNWGLSKRVVVDIYNNIKEFIEMKNVLVYIFHILLKTIILITEIPKQYWDKNTRILSTKITFEILRLSLFFNENYIAKRVLFSQVGQAFNRKWYTVSRIIQVVFQEEVEDKKGAAKKDPKKDPKKEPAVVEQQPEKKLIPKLVRKLFEYQSQQQTFLEEFLLNLPEEIGGADFVSKFVEKWKEIIEGYNGLVENTPEELEKMNQGLFLWLDFAELFKDLPSAFQKMTTNYKGSPFFIEMSCKLLKKCIENNAVQLNQINDFITQTSQLPEMQNASSQSFVLGEKIKDLKIKALENDIEWYPHMLEYLIKEKEINQGVGKDLAIELFTQYFSLQKELNTLLQKEDFLNMNALTYPPTQQAVGTQQSMSQLPPQQNQDFVPPNQRFQYLNLWAGEFQNIRAQITYMMNKEDNSQKSSASSEYIFFSIQHMDVENVKNMIEMEKVLKKFQGEKDKKKILALENTFLYFSQAAIHACNSKSWEQLLNISKYIYNILVYDMLNPFQHINSKIWLYLAIISYCLIEMLQYVHKKNFDVLRNENAQKRNVRVEDVEFGNLGQTVTFKDQEEEEKKEVLPQLSQHLTKEYWFDGKNELSVTIIANIIAYSVQTFMLEEKWEVLIGITRSFCNEMQHYYSQFLLPFLIFAQDLLYQKAHDLTQGTIKRLEDRTKVYEDWKNNNKRRKTRQAALTGEIPEEQIQYEKDKQILEKLIQLQTDSENFIKSQLILSQKIIQELQRDCNQALEELKKSRQLLRKFCADAQQQDNKKNRNIQQSFATTILHQLKNTISILQKRQEKYAITQANKDLGGFYFARGNFNAIHDAWNEGLDMIFKANALKNFRQLFVKFGEYMAHVLGVQSVLMGSNILSNLQYIIYHSNLKMERECLIMASQMVFSIFKVSLPHPQALSFYSNYRVQEILQKQNIFADSYMLDSVETLLCTEKICWGLIDADLSIWALPSICLVEYIATDVVYSTFYSFRSKIMKCISLAMCGDLKYSIQNLQKLLNEKDLPSLWVKQSEFVKRKNGINWDLPQENFYQNNQGPFFQSNKELLDSIVSKFDIEKGFGKAYGQLNVNLLMYAKALIIYSAFECENADQNDINEQRNVYLNKSDAFLKVLLKKLAFEEELHCIEEEIRITQEKIAQQIHVEELQKKLETLQNDRLQHFIQRGITDQAQMQEYFSAREELLNYSQKRDERLKLMCRVRYLRSKIYQQMQLHIKSYYTLFQGISNINKYVCSYRLVEQGEEPENNALEQIKQQEEAAFGGGGAQNKGKQPPKKETAPPAAQQKQPDPKNKGKGGQEIKTDENYLEKRKAELEELQKIVYQQAQEGKFRNHLNAFWFIKLRYELCIVLYQQNRFEDAYQYIQHTLKDCQQLQDVYFSGILQQYEARIDIKTGKYEEALKKFEKLQQFFIQNNIDQTIENAKFSADFSEIFFERNQRDKALQCIQNSLTIIENQLRDICFDYQLQNENEKAAKEGVLICNELQLPQEVEQELLKKIEPAQQIKDPKAAAAAAKKDVKKPAGKDDPKAKGKGKDGKKDESAQQEMKVESLNPFQINDFSKERKYNYTNIDIEKINCKKDSFNSYNWQLIQLYIKVGVRYAYYYLIQHSQNRNLENISQLLQKLEKIIELTIPYMIPVSLKTEFLYIQALYQKIQFENNIREIQEEYIRKYEEGRKSKDEEVREKVKKYRKIALKKPFQDLCRNKYLIEIPCFSQFLKEKYLPLLSNAHKYLEQALTLITKGECCLFIENSRKLEDYFLLFSEILLLKREYRPRVGSYKYLKLKELKQNTQDIEQTLENQLKNDQQECIKLEQEENFPEEAKNQLQNISTLPLDIYFDIIESDYIYKKNYNPILFEESKKKLAVSSVDILLYINKLSNETQFFTFTSMHLQNKITKVHKYLKAQYPNYNLNYTVQQNIDASAIEPGAINIKNTYCKFQNLNKFVYMLGPLDKTKLQVSEINQEEINKIILNEEKDIIYGKIFINSESLNNLLQQSLDLKMNMQESDKKSPAVKERDYKYHKVNFRNIIEEFGSFFFQKESDNEKKGEREVEYLDKYGPFVPVLNQENIQILVDMFNQLGLQTKNMNILAIMRYFHNNKYK